MSGWCACIFNFVRSFQHQVHHTIWQDTNDDDDDGSVFPQRPFNYALFTGDEMYHWIRNDEEAPNPILILLLGARDEHSPLSLIRGLEDIVFKNIATWSVSPCNCCRKGPVAFCCRRRRRMLIDKNKAPQPTLEGEVPDELFCQDDVLLYEENLEPPFFYIGGDFGHRQGYPIWEREGTTYLAITAVGCHYDGKYLFKWKSSSNVLVTTKWDARTLNVIHVNDPTCRGGDLSFKYELTVIRVPNHPKFYQIIHDKRKDVVESCEYKDIADLFKSQIPWYQEGCEEFIDIPMQASTSVSGTNIEQSR